MPVRRRGVRDGGTGVALIDKRDDHLFAGHLLHRRRDRGDLPADHALRKIRAVVDDVLRNMSREFDRLYADVGRPSVPPERLLRAQLRQIFYSIRSERLFVEQLDYNLLVRGIGDGRVDLDAHGLHQ
jgi:hypothetical protein